MRATVNTIQKHWEGCSSEQLKKNMTSLNYIRDLAGRTNTNIARWNLVALFGTGSGADLVNDTNKINKVFFEKLSSQVASDPSETDDLPEVDPRLKAQLSRFVGNMHKQEVEQLKRQADHSKRNAHYSYEQYEQHMREASKCLAKLKTLESDRTGNARVNAVERGIAETVAEGFWGDVIISDDGAIWLRTMSDITLSEIRRAAGIETVVNLGKFAVRIDLPGGSVRVTPYKGNKRADDFYHPHVNEDGDICWGDASEMSYRHMTEWSVKELLFLLQELLCSYNPSNPYTKLSEFEHASAYGRRAAGLRCPHIDRDSEESIRKKLNGAEATAA